MLPSYYQPSLMLRLFVLAFLVGIFIVPLGMIQSVIHERQAYRAEAVGNIASGWAGTQTVWGPVLVVPYTKDVKIEQQQESGKAAVTKTQRQQLYHYVLPETLDGAAEIASEKRYRGIYAIPVYNADIELKGRFANALPDRDKDKSIEIGAPYVFFGVSDVRGIGGDTSFTWKGETRPIEAGTQENAVQNGFHVMLPALPDGGEPLEFSLSLRLKGMETLRFLPAGKSTNVTMASAWPDPSFEGLYLPSERSVTDKGFSAKWQTGFLATNIESQLESCLYSRNCETLLANGFGVSLFQPVDIYQQSLRSAKYGILFVFMTFATFFLFEVLRQMRIHPVQYLLVGSALALFYLLLVSLSEHLSFTPAYIVASAAIVLLLGYYVSHVLQNRHGGALFGGLVALLYLVMYFILRSEDYALLMGSGILFALLAAIMVLTRRVDWYGLGRPGQAGAPADPYKNA